MTHENQQPSCCHPSQPRALDGKIIALILLAIGACAVSFVIPLVVPFQEHFLMYLSKVWWALLLGLVIGGAIDHFVSREYISHQLAGQTRAPIVRSVLLGFLMSACCHGIIAIAMQLYRKGASTASVVTFLLASPWANLTWTIFMIGFFGWAKGFYIIGVSLVIALVTGMIFQHLERTGHVETNPNTVDNKSKDHPRFWNVPVGHTLSLRDAVAVGQGMLSLANMVLFWALVGLVSAAAIGAYVPTHIFHHYLGPTFGGMMATLAIATVIEVCSEGSTPIAFEIFRQTGALGNSLVFLLAGVATDYTEIGILWQNVGRKTALWLPLLTVPQIVFWGWIGNLIF